MALIELFQGPHFDLVYLVQGQLLHLVFALPQDVIVVPDLAHGVLVLLALLIELLLQLLNRLLILLRLLLSKSDHLILLNHGQNCLFKTELAAENARLVQLGACVHPIALILQLVFIDHDHGAVDGRWIPQPVLQHLLIMPIGRVRTLILKVIHSCATERIVHNDGFIFR